ncbi:MAG: hypothetical protein QXF25_03225 [Candidatus Pacearchaeota archaeon]
MRTTILFLTMSLLLASFVVAEQGQAADRSGQAVDQAVDQAIQAGQGIMTRIQAGKYKSEAGQEFGIEAGEGEKLRLRIRNVTAHIGLDITPEQVQDRVKLMTRLSNGRNAEIKVMPDSASERALERLRLRVCSPERNCTITLKEVGTGNQTRAAYEVQAERHARILGLFQTKMRVRAEVDAENGEVISVGKPWWSFLATEAEESA